MDNQEALSAVRNALQFLGPLAALAPALEQMASEGVILSNDRTAIEASHKEREAAERATVAVQAAYLEEQRRLDNLYRNGVEDVIRRAREVEAETGRALQARFQTATKEVVDLEEEQDRLAGSVVSLRKERDTLQDDIRWLESRVKSLKQDLAKIAQQAGGA